MDAHKAVLAELENLMSSHAVLRAVKAGEILLSQDEPVKDIFFIQTGRAQACAYSIEGQETWVCEFAAGDLFGHAALLTDEPVQFQIVAQTDMCVFTLNAQKFNSLFVSEQIFSQYLSRELARRLVRMTERLLEIATLSAAGRVCSELLRMSKPVGVDDEKLIVRPNPVIVDLAMRISSTRETVSRAVSQLQRKGILGREPGAILINKPDQLRDKIR